MRLNSLDCLTSELAGLKPVHTVGRVRCVDDSTLHIAGLSQSAALGDRVRLRKHNNDEVAGEIIRLDHSDAVILPEKSPEGVSVGDRAVLLEPIFLCPTDTWAGRVIDPLGRPLDGRPLFRGASAYPLKSSPPPAAKRRSIGARLETNHAVFDTFLPIAKGQRLGLFAGSGVGKSNLLGSLGRKVEADIVVFALIGERGRELSNFINNVLGPEGMKRSVVVAATSDSSPLLRRRCAWTAMAVAEYFRDQGRHVLLLADSVTRFAEAHREIATAAGELPVLRGFPATTAHMLMALCERAGPGTKDTGDITALFSVLVSGADMDEPIADILRGVLDGHVVLSRNIAERGRYPAVDLLRSISRSLPESATPDENALLLNARKLLGAYAESETMVKTGLYTVGSDPVLDQAVKFWPDLEAFLVEVDLPSSKVSFNKLALALRRCGALPSTAGKNELENKNLSGLGA